MGEGELADWMERNGSMPEWKVEERTVADCDGGGTGSALVGTAGVTALGEWDLDELARWFGDG